MRFSFKILLVGALLCLLGTATAQAKEITRKCRVTVPGTKAAWAEAVDGRYKSAWTHRRSKDCILTVQLPSGTQEGGLYVCFKTEPEEMVVKSSEREIYRRQGAGLAHRYVPFTGDELLTLELYGGEHSVSINEFKVFSGAQPPDWVQQWQPPLTYADLLVIVAHPDDELLWLGGAIPYYALERGKRVAVAYMTCANHLRRSELLNGLWTAGVQNYPFIGSFCDVSKGGIRGVQAAWGGEDKVVAHVTQLIRQLQPQVVLTHDLRGEYGHPAHIITARAVLKALEASGDARQFPDSAAEHGTWDVPKTYIHLYKENPIVMQWQQPIAARGGKTALQVCADAFKQHRSADPKYKVEARGRYSPTRFGLYRTLVGPDVQCDDFFEHLDENP
ncbi:MAG: PIG-L deacetylase family protein [Christensenellales bacterium]|jgi:LmbE family N-acetylglucosaminyl deacetylase